MTVIGIGEATSGTSSPTTMLRIALRRWRKHVAGPFGRYRPELHYMRGPGPQRGGKPRPADRAL